MKKFSITGLICFSAICVFALEKQTIPAKDIIIGRDFRTNTDISAKEFVFPEIIYRWTMNDSTKMLNLQLRGTKRTGDELNDDGYITAFDFQNRQTHWNQQVDYLNSTIDQYDNLLIKTSKYQTSCLSSETGEDLWSIPNSICYVNASLGIGVGYKMLVSDELSNKFAGINLRNGQTTWIRKISREYNTNGIYQLNDSVILVSANGLHSINLKTGKGWDYEANTGRKDYAGTVASNIFNVAFSLLLNSDLQITTGHDVISEVGSAPLIDSTGIYMADRKSLVRIDRNNGNVLWKSDLPRNKISRSSVFFKDSLVYLVNDGFAFYNSESIHYGKAFIAGYNKRTGKKAFLSQVGYDKEQILSYETLQDTLFLLSKNRIFKYSLKDGNELWERNLKTDSLGELTQFSGAGMYVRSDSAITPLLSDNNTLCVLSTKNQLLVLNNQFKITNVIPYDKVYYCYLETNEYRFLEDGERTLVTDKNNRPIAGLDISGNTMCISNKLYEVQVNSIVEIDLNQLIANSAQSLKEYKE